MEEKIKDFENELKECLKGLTCFYLYSNNPIVIGDIDKTNFNIKINSIFESKINNSIKKFNMPRINNDDLNIFHLFNDQEYGLTNNEKNRLLELLKVNTKNESFMIKNLLLNDLSLDLNFEQQKELLKIMKKNDYNYNDFYGDLLREIKVQAQIMFPNREYLFQDSKLIKGLLKSHLPIMFTADIEFALEMNTIEYLKNDLDILHPVLIEELGLTIENVKEKLEPFKETSGLIKNLIINKFFMKDKIQDKIFNKIILEEEKEVKINCKWLIEEVKKYELSVEELDLINNIINTITRLGKQGFPGLHNYQKEQLKKQIEVNLMEGLKDYSLFTEETKDIKVGRLDTSARETFMEMLVAINKNCVTIEPLIDLKQEEEENIKNELQKEKDKILLRIKEFNDSTENNKSEKSKKSKFNFI